MKLWFNQSFSLRNIVARIASERPEVGLCVSAIDPESPVRDVAPEFWEEPARGTVDYPEWLLAKAIERRVDALIAQRGRMDVAPMRERFAAAGIALHVAADAETLRLLDD